MATLRPVVRLRPDPALRNALLDGSDGSLTEPSHCIALPDCHTFVASSTRDDRLQFFSAAGELAALSVDGACEFCGPYGLAASECDLFIADCRANRVVVIDRATFDCRAIWSGVGNPIAVALDEQRAFVTEHRGHTVAACDTTSGRVLFRFGGEGSGVGELWRPCGIALSSSTVYVADSWNGRIALFTRDGAWLGAWGREGGGLAQFQAPYGVAVSGGALVVSEEGGRRVQLLALADGAPLGEYRPESIHGPCGRLRMVSAHGANGLLVADGERRCVYALVVIDWLRRWQALALLWRPLCAWRQRAAERAFAPGGAGYEAVANSTLIGRW
jgi:hypothetical protein